MLQSYRGRVVIDGLALAAAHTVGLSPAAAADTRSLTPQGCADQACLVCAEIRTKTDVAAAQPETMQE